MDEKIVVVDRVGEELVLKDLVLLEMLLLFASVVLLIVTCDAWIMRTRLAMVASNTEAGKLSIPKGKVWPGNRPPVPNVLLFEQRMDATWGRGKMRSEVWEDEPNPLNSWWEAYKPSEETVEAMNLGFDFEDPKGWLEVLVFIVTDVCSRF